MSLRDGRMKMSKSDPSDQSRINLLDTPDQILAKIRRAKTDPLALPETVEGLADRPEADNLVGVYAALTDQTKAAVLSQFAGQGFGVFKPALAEAAVETLRPISAAMSRLMADPAEIDRVLGEGARRAAAVADPIVAETKALVGFWRPTSQTR
jgi:tryptophanyl-tRNA synthetase